MLNAERMIARLPQYLQGYSEGSILRSVMESFASELENAENALEDLMRSRWFFHADLPDLERTGILFGISRLPGEPKTPYRRRFYLTVQELLMGAGTVESISNIVEAIIGAAPEIEENPPELVNGPWRELGADEIWREYNRSVKEDRPTIIIRSLARVRNPTITNLTTEESITYVGILRRGAVLRILADGSASLSGIDVTGRMVYTISDEPQEEVLAPRVPKLYSEWKYTDATAFFDYAHFSEAVFAAGRREKVAVRMRWTRYKPATFDVRIPLYSKTGRKKESVGYERHLRQEVRHLVDHVKCAGVMANINFYDHFSEKFSCMDLGPELRFGQGRRERVEEKERLDFRVEYVFCERQGCRDELHSCGAFDITEFDSGNAWG